MFTNELVVRNKVNFCFVIRHFTWWTVQTNFQTKVVCSLCLQRFAATLQCVPMQFSWSNQLLQLWPRNKLQHFVNAQLEFLAEFAPTLFFLQCKFLCSLLKSLWMIYHIEKILLKSYILFQEIQLEQNLQMLVYTRL